MEHWNFNGVMGHGPAPEGMLGKYKGQAIVIIGGARCVWQDLKDLAPDKDIPLMAVNDIGMYLNQHLKHWASLHSGFLAHWLPLRTEHALNRPATHGYKAAKGIDCVWKLYNDGAMSGFFALKIALAMGYDRIVLCGIPMDSSGHFWDPTWRATGNHDEKHSKNAFLSQMIYNKRIRECVRSMSGWTREALGAPSENFLSK